MKIFVTADLHYDIRRSRQPAEQCARQANQAAQPEDILVLVGDIAGADVTVFRDALQLFADFPGKKCFVPGNHCLWTLADECSLHRYQTLLPELAEQEQFTMLDTKPLVIESHNLALAGSIGWYDYSLRDAELAIPLPFYREKISPGAARYYGQHDHLLEQFSDDLTDRHFSLGARWMDGWRVNLGMSDEEFLDMLLKQLRGQLDKLSNRYERIIAFVHHLPFGELVPANRPDRFTFAAAYLGAERIGELLLNYPAITDVFCGHSHWPGELQIDHLNVVNVGSTYIQKQLKILEIV